MATVSSPADEVLALEGLDEPAAEGGFAVVNGKVRSTTLGAVIIPEQSSAMAVGGVTGLVIRAMPVFNSQHCPRLAPHWGKVTLVLVVAAGPCASFPHDELVQGESWSILTVGGRDAQIRYVPLCEP
jgi:hypothetical protein